MRIVRTKQYSSVILLQLSIFIAIIMKENRSTIDIQLNLIIVIDDKLMTNCQSYNKRVIYNIIDIILTLLLGGFRTVQLLMFVINVIFLLFHL